MAELATYVGGPPILSKFACITKQRADGTLKRRIIMDSKRSGVTAASKRQYRAVLPRHTDLMQGVLQLLSTAQPAESVWFMVQDAVDAYWQMLLASPRHILLHRAVPSRLERRKDRLHGVLCEWQVRDAHVLREGAPSFPQRVSCAGRRVGIRFLAESSASLLSARGSA